YVAMEIGLTSTGVGRPPWIVYNLMGVADAVTPAPGSFVSTMLSMLIVVYSAITLIFVMALLRLAVLGRHEDERELVQAPETGAPYGPRLDLATDDPARPMRPSP